VANPFIVMEAIHSVALSHPEDCRCTTCRAAEGDKRALAEIFAAVAQSEATSPE
jgi:hypothetical protein